MNPYTLTFGKEPNQHISRIKQTNEIINLFQEDTTQALIITGVRGSGKTVLMTEVAKRLADEDWVTIELNSSTDMLKSLGAKLLSKQRTLFSNINIAFSVFNVEIGTKEKQIIDIEVAISTLLKALNKHNKKLLITVDEVTNTEYMRQFSSAFQIFLREDAPIYLLMTGLFENIRELQNEKSLTFLYRAPRLEIEPLNNTAIINNYKNVLGVSEDLAKEMARLTKGYSYAFQVLGHLIYKNGDLTEDVICLYRQYLEEYVYEKIWHELSKKDQQIALGIAKSETGNSAEIQKMLDLPLYGINPYRKRLIDRGIIDGNTRGYLKFTLPLFKEFVIDRENIYE